MLSFPFQNLAIALCLTLQVTATAFAPCACPCTHSQIEDGSQDAGLLLASTSQGSSKTCCLLCESRTETQHSMCPSSVDRQDRPPTALAPIPALSGSGTLALKLAEMDASNLTAPESCQLQVFLE